jgi:hypothetical protein
MFVALLFGQASADGVQFFQPPVGGFLSQGSMVSQAVPFPMVPALSPPLAIQRPLQPGPVMVQDPMHEFARFEAGEPFGPSAVPEAEASFAPASFQEFFVVLATGIEFLVMALANRRKMQKAKVASFAMTPALSEVAKRTRAGGVRMSDSWNADDDEQLRREMDKSLGPQKLIHGPAEQVMQYRIMAYVVVFNRGTANEGVYTLESSVGGSKGQLLTFENTEDAIRFTSLLQGEEFSVVGNDGSVSLEAQPFMWDTQRIEQFCQGGDFEVALVPSGGIITPPEKNMYDPARFGGRPNSPDDRFQNRRSMHNRAPTFGQQMRNNFAARGYDQRRRAHDILRNTQMSNNQRRGGKVWEDAMRNAKAASERREQADFGEEMCGIEECGMDKFLGERYEFERLFGSGPWESEGPGDGPGPWGPGPDGPGPWGPRGPGPWGP